MDNTAERLLAVQKLTALWAFAECGLGGMMHALKLPFTGLLVGGFAVIVLSLIAWYSRYHTRMILSATFLVLLVKAVLSPHTPFPAYVAVAFQGLLAALLFAVIRSHRLGTLLLCVITLAQSAVQKVLILTIFYGNSIWQAVDELVKKISTELNVNINIAASAWLIGAYVGLHILAGIVIGYWSGNLPSKIGRFKIEHKNETVAELTPVKAGAYPKQVIMLIVAVFISLILYTGKTEWLMEAGLLVIRLMLITASFYIISRLLHYFLLRRSGHYAVRIKQVINTLPLIRYHAHSAWRYAKGRSGLGKLSGFLVSLIVLSLESDTDH